jgi:hypothetical protein
MRAAQTDLRQEHASHALWAARREGPPRPRPPPEIYKGVAIALLTTNCGEPLFRSLLIRRATRYSSGSGTVTVPVSAPFDLIFWIGSGANHASARPYKALRFAE